MCQLSTKVSLQPAIYRPESVGIAAVAADNHYTYTMVAFAKIMSSENFSIKRVAGPKST